MSYELELRSNKSRLNQIAAISALDELLAALPQFRPLWKLSALRRNLGLDCHFTGPSASSLCFVRGRTSEEDCGVGRSCCCCWCCCWSGCSTCCSELWLHPGLTRPVGSALPRLGPKCAALACNMKRIKWRILDPNLKRGSQSPVHVLGTRQK